MGWFKRHLNLIAVIVTVAVLVLFIILFMIAIDLYYIERPVKTYDMLFTNILPIITGCFFLLMVCYGWILMKKKRSLLFLSFLVLFYIFLFTVIFVVYIIFFVPGFNSNNAILVCFIASTALSIAGFMVLLFLKNLSPDKGNTGYTTFHTRIMSAVNTRLDKITIYSIIALLILLSGLTAYSNYSMNHNYRVLGGYYYSFELPQSFQYPPPGFGHQRQGEIDTIYLSREKFDWYKKGQYEWFTLYIWSNRVFETVQEKPVENRLMTYLYEIVPGYFDFGYFIKDKNIIPTMVDGIEAHYIHTVIEEDYSEWYEYWETTDSEFIETGSTVWGTLNAVCFEYNDRVWIIMMVYPDQEKPGYDPVLEHVVETFEFH